MRIGAFEIQEPVPELHEPHIFTMIRPWVDVGNVVSLTLERLERHFRAKELGRLAKPGNFLDFTRYRPNMYWVEGKREITIPNSIIRYAQPQGGPDMLFFHLLEPHAFAEDYTDSVLEVFKYFRIRRYCRLGAMYDSVPHTRPVIVTGDPGNIPMKGDRGGLRTRMSRPYQGPTSIMNLVSDGVPNLGLEVDTLNFMVHLPHYLQLDEDFAGVTRLLEVLSSIYDLPAAIRPTQRGQRQYRELEGAVSDNPELKALIQEMEQEYDSEAEAAQGEEAPPPASLSPEVERFLQEMDERFSDPDSPSR
jgi:hypothetical protein